MSSAQPADRPRLTVAMMVRDEQDLLPDALASVRDIADEVLVVDTGSRDATLWIAGKNGARVVRAAWQDDFSAARNRGLDAATGDWILWLDAGERLAAESASELRDFINSKPATDRVWLCTVKLPPERVDAPSERVGRIRLMPRRPDLRFFGRVRETLRPAIAQAGLTVEIGPWLIYRTAREHDPELKRARAERDLRLIEMEIKESGACPRLCVALGEVCATLGNLTKATEYFRQAVRTAAPGSTEMLAGYYGLVTSFPADAPPGNAQLEVCIEALEVFPYDAQLLCAMAGYLQAQGHFGLAQRSYRAAHQFGQIDPETWHIGAIGEVAAICLSLNLQLMSEDEAALAVLKEAEPRFPKSTRLARRRLELEVKHGRMSDALELVDRLGVDQHNQNLLRSAVRGASVASQKNWIPALAYLETSYKAGCRDPLCLRWYTIALFATGQAGPAQEVLGEWLKAEPNCAEALQFRQQLEAPASEPGEHSQDSIPARPGRVPAPHIHPLPRAANQSTSSR